MMCLHLPGGYPKIGQNCFTISPADFVGRSGLPIFVNDRMISLARLHLFRGFCVHKFSNATDNMDLPSSILDHLPDCIKELRFVLHPTVFPTSTLTEQYSFVQYPISLFLLGIPLPCLTSSADTACFFPLDDDAEDVRNNSRKWSV
jgi:hypothetical protein